MAEVLTVMVMVIVVVSGTHATIKQSILRCSEKQTCSRIEFIIARSQNAESRKLSS